MMPSLTDSSSRAHVHSGHRFSADEKFAAVKRLLGGEEAKDVAAEMNISLHRLRRWERTFLDAGRNGLADAHGHHSSWFRQLKKWQVPSWGALLVLLVLLLGAAATILRMAMAAEP